jgi:diguanylate cyclase (GGDEF)-like protein/PAS domain S-box-containing protein
VRPASFALKYVQTVGLKVCEAYVLSKRTPFTLGALLRGWRVKNLLLALTSLIGVPGTLVRAPWLQRLRHRLGAPREVPELQAMFEHSPHGSFVVDARSLQILTTNAALRQTLGLNDGELKALTLQQLFAHDEDANTLISRLRDASSRTSVRTRRRGPNGQMLDIEISGYPIDLGERHLLAYTTHDVTVRSSFEAQLLENQQRLDHLAHHDQLTGLPNRLFLAAHLPGAIEAARRSGQILAILFLDLDRFKHINDSLGHETGDALLKAVAQKIRSTARSADVAVRMGGDEFIVILKEVTDTSQVNEAAERIVEALSRPFVVNGRSLATTVSIGVSLFPRDGADMGELLRHSDTAMYQAKERGRNNWQIFSPIMGRRLKARVAIESHLRAALQLSQLDVYYQPIVDIESQRVVALESLVRWKHPEHGFISPTRFIGVAEESGLIVPIGEFVLQRVLEDARRWLDAGHTMVPIAINVSAIQLQRYDFAGLIVKMTNAMGLRPTMLQIELTESAVFETLDARNGETNNDCVANLRKLGIDISIDDFGTGYSSLSYLKHWSFDYLKIDRTFVRDLGTDMSDLAIVGAIIAMARHLNIRVIAEGIEGWQQLEKLRELGCSLAQGHLFAKPTPARECERFLTGKPIDLANRDRRLEPIEVTGINQIQITELLEGGRQASG